MPALTSYQPVVTLATASITSGNTASATIDLMGATLCGIHLPAALTGTSLSFQIASASGGTYQTLQKNGGDFALPVTQGRYVSLDPATFAGVQFLKIVSSAAEAANRTLTLAVRPV